MSVDQFADAMRATLGAAPNADRIAPGRIVRFATNDKRSDDSGWCMLFEDGRAGVFGSWRTGEQHVWHSSKATVRDRHRFEETAAAQAARAEEQAQRNAKAGETARLIWTRAQRCLEHPYLDRKRVRPDGVRVQVAHAPECRGQFYCQSEPLRGLLLLVPLRDMQWRISSLQAIDVDDRKSFLRGSRTSGGFHLIGADKLRGVNASTFDGPVAVCEGYATGWSIVHQLDGCPTFVAFNAGNLAHVTREVFAKFPKAQVVVCGDSDPSGVGQAKAIEAASAIGGMYSIPEFTAEESARGLTDWNDYAQLPRAKVDA